MLQNRKDDISILLHCIDFMVDLINKFHKILGIFLPLFSTFLLFYIFQLLYKVGIFMHELRYQNESKLDAAAIKCCELVLQILEDCAVHVLPPPEVRSFW